MHLCMQMFLNHSCLVKADPFFFFFFFCLRACFISKTLVVSYTNGFYSSQEKQGNENSLSLRMRNGIERGSSQRVYMLTHLSVMAQQQRAKLKNHSKSKAAMATLLVSGNLPRQGLQNCINDHVSRLRAPRLLVGYPAWVFSRVYVRMVDILWEFSKQTPEAAARRTANLASRGRQRQHPNPPRLSGSASPPSSPLPPAEVLIVTLRRLCRAAKSHWLLLNLIC